jgi:hypothetical protein
MATCAREEMLAAADAAIALETQVRNLALDDEATSAAPAELAQKPTRQSRGKRRPRKLQAVRAAARRQPVAPST